MFNATLQRLYTNLRKYRFFEQVFDVLEHTPTHAMHWYALMVFGVAVTVCTILLAWFVFRGVTIQINENSNQALGAVTIRRDALEGVLTVYQTRAAELVQLKQKAPSIIDPGR